MKLSRPMMMDRFDDQSSREAIEERIHASLKGRQMPRARARDSIKDAYSRGGDREGHIRGYMSHFCEGKSSARAMAAGRLPAITPPGKIPAGLKGLIELPRAIVAKTA